MTVLEKSTRKQLDKAVQAARRVATTGADRALRALSVDQEKKPAHLSAGQSELRRQLRVVCRRLGSWDTLVQATAYEQWHRMLFSRFLAENNLLIHPVYHAAVTLEECSELAREKGVDQWEVAAEFAARMLPGIFLKDDPLLLLKYTPENREALKEILSGIPAETFRTQDALGWTYQFWQSEEKERVNKSEKKIEGADICAVTQLFTEHYMVQFLLQNTLGAWWLRLHPDSLLRKEWVYYKDKVQHDFSTFPKTAKEIKLLDPACGSGHFLVEAFHMLLAMREEEGESREEATRGIIRDNLHGLEIDSRCIQIAGFAVAMEAWKCGFPSDQYLPLPNLACTGLSIRAERSEWLKLAAGDGLLEGELEKYYDLFKNADSLGSLIQIEEGSSLVPTNILTQKLEAALTKEKAIGDPVAEAFGETVSGVLKAVSYLRRKDFHIVVTNPPFLGKWRQSKSLQNTLKNLYPSEKNEIATCFITRSRKFLCINGYSAFVSPLYWLSLPSYSSFREKFLSKNTISVISALGSHAFELISGEVVKIMLFIFRIGDTGSNRIAIIDCQDCDTVDKKIGCMNEKSIFFIDQSEQRSHPDSRIFLGKIIGSTTIGDYADSYGGLQSGDYSRYILFFWEILAFNDIWEYYQLAPDSSDNYSGYQGIVRWENGKGSLVSCPSSRVQGLQGWGKKGLGIRLMGKLNVSFFNGEKFDKGLAAIIPKNQDHLKALWAFFTDVQFKEIVKLIDQSLKITNGSLEKIPFDLAHWQKVAEEMGPLPKPHSDNPTQWLFKGNITGSEPPLHVAIARLLGYRWPEQTIEDPLDHFADRDGIVCIPPARGERPAVDRLRDLLAAAYGSEWSLRKEEELLRLAGYTKNGGLEGFLRDEFFPSHCKLFHQRPFIWHLWDGTKDGFSALVNYHKLDRKNLEKLIYSYLGAWINLQKEEVRQEKAGAERRLAAAEELKKKLELILEGEKPFDSYVRWKPLHKQAIGWDPDLNDGVRMNIRPFVEAGVLRWTPNIKWGKDRGKDPVPNCSGTTERLNDLHFSLEDKRKAREVSK